MTYNEYMVLFLILLTSLYRLSYADIAHLYFDRNDYTESAKYLERFFIENSYQEHSEEALILGECYFKLKDYTHAEGVLKKAFCVLRQPEQKTECLLMLGMIKYECGEYDRAVLIFERALHLKTSRLAEILVWLGKSEYKRRGYLKAMGFLEAAKSLHDGIEIPYWYGLTLLRLEQYARADSVFSSVPAQSPWGLRSLLFRGYTLHLMGLDQEAREVFQSIFTSQDFPADSHFIRIAHLHLGCIAMSEEEYEEAIQHLTITREVVSREISDGALFRIGWSHYMLSEWDEATEAFQILLDRHPKSKFWESACYFLGETEYKRMRYPKALKVFNRLLRETPNSKYASHSLYASAYCYYHLDSLSSSVERFEEYIDKYPESDLLPYVRYRIGFSAYRIGDYAKAINHLKPLALDGVPLLSNEAHYLIALSYYSFSNYDLALNELERLKKKEKPMRVEAQKLLGDILFQKEEYWRAIGAYKQIPEEFLGEKVPSTIIDEGRYQIERSLLKLGLYSSPVTMLKAYIRKYPESSKSPKLQMELAQYYLETGEYYKAIKEFERFLELFGSRIEDAEAKIGLAKSYEKLGLFKKAREKYLQVSQESPFASRAWFNAANISFRLGELGRTISECQSLIEKFQGTPYGGQALYMQGKCYINLKRYEEAILIYEKLLLEYPGSVSMENFRFDLAFLALEEGLIEDGLKMLHTKWSSDSLKGEALLKAGTVFFELGQYQDAASELLEASEYLSLDRKAEALFKAGETLELIGDDSQAYLLYRNALEVVVNEKLRGEILQKIEHLQLYLKSKESE